MKQLSNCHKAPVTVDTADEGTSCFMCSECNRPCDVYHGLQLEQQVVSLNLAKRLKELNVQQQSFVYWVKESEIEGCEYYNVYEPYQFRDMPYAEIYSAFTSSELGELLPVKIGDLYFTAHRCIRNGWWSLYAKKDFEDGRIAFWDQNETNGRARLLIYLIENNLLKL